ncbi:ribosomal-protein-alanine acetyltransferase [Pseudohongiella nitratireducens]|uniref:[Ribosomal protein bS18]-alanine N-acetyltransferase n=1 Tax=Pseudohongiella nitratireducens TaxID=1768907 RepID=A0A917LSJ1_9GAMM|nr:ribosomal protein S18-alanine N-acetyltransferase [Pseudohongiella nitratireducens]GGG54370.1 ribosomal-protein-alanine acetyltransferase [Pseudohongiella nitratireducens]|tara:strand:+ start:3515 stop:4033 length:519 start_codon:yes stop_codon:yes gene_type:complete
MTELDPIAGQAPSIAIGQSLTCRRMTAEDLDQVVRNENLSYDSPWTRRIFQDCISAGYECWVISDGIKVLCHGVLSVAVGESHLLTLCVHPQARRHSLGRQMLRKLLTEARVTGAADCFLEVRPSNEAARGLYYEFGFIQVGERRGYYPASSIQDDREDALIMSCRLNEVQL